MCVYSPPGNRPNGVERYTEYATDVARTMGARTRYPKITLGPVSSHASPVTLKIPAPIRIPINTAYDSRAPRSRRKPEDKVALEASRRASTAFDCSVDGLLA